MEELTKEQFFAKISEETKNMPPNWRKGQKVFNAVDIIFGVAREVQFQHKVDCFHDDTKIDEFKEKAYEVYKKYFKNIEKSNGNMEITQKENKIESDKELDYNDYMDFFKEHPEYDNCDLGAEECWVFAEYFFRLGLKNAKEE